MIDSSDNRISQITASQGKSGHSFSDSKETEAVRMSDMIERYDLDVDILSFYTT